MIGGMCSLETIRTGRSGYAIPNTEKTKQIW